MAQTMEVRGVATNVRTENGETIVRYHSTDVVKFTDKRVVLDSGGWSTNTTRTRMNQAANQYGLGFSVYQEKFAWFVKMESGAVIPFKDGMVIKR